LHAHVGDIVETLKHSGRQHALVVEDEPLTEKPTIRGIFSASQIARQLGIPLQAQELAQTFEQIDLAIKAQHTL
ncbi:MAG: CBS domain-containing protein, partial [Thiobacillus sp.]